MSDRASDFTILTPQSLTESVASELRKRINAGQLQPGERLVEASLAMNMGISRAPVREALRQLEHEGLVASRPRRGYVVRQLSSDELFEIYDLRALLEPELARSAAARIRVDDLAALRAIVGRMREAAYTSNVPEIVSADREFHALIGKLSGCPLTAQIFDNLNEQVRRFTELMVPTYNDIEQMVDEHDDLLAALASGDPEIAAREMYLHLEDARQRLTAVLGDSAFVTMEHAVSTRDTANDRNPMGEQIPSDHARDAT